MRMYLDSVRKDSNKSEYRMIPRCTCAPHVLTGDGPLIENMGKLLLEHGFSPDLEVGVYRGTTEVFAPAKLALIARGYRTGEQPEHLRKRDG